jgi:nitrite reductase/ring-hydroxylating ferredoxin subunit
LSAARPDAAVVVGPLAAVPDGEVTVRDIEGSGSVLLLRRGAEVRAYRNLCPHQWLPLTYRSERILSADGTRLRCSNHGAEFSLEDGRPLDSTLPCGLEPVPAHIDADGRVLLRPQL